MAAPALKRYAQGQTNVSADNLNSFEQTANTYDDLRAFEGTTGMQVFLRGGNVINDGLGGEFYWSPNATADDNNSDIIAPAGADVGRWLRVEQLPFVTQVIWLPAYGARFDGVTDDTDAWEAAIAAASALEQSTIMMPAGRSVVTRQLTPPTTPCTIRGQGMECSIIDWANTENLFYRAYAGSQLYSSLAFQDFQVEGKWSDYQDDSPEVIPFLIFSTDDVRFSGVRVYNVTFFGITTRSCNRVVVDNCQMLVVARDGISCTTCNFVQITNNRIDHCDDDAIAVHTQDDAPSFVDQGVVIANNRISDSQGIKCLGGRRMLIVGNQLERCRAQGIAVGPASSDEGNTTPFAVTIANNVITDIFNRSTIDGLSNSNNYIYISGRAQASGAGSAVPGLFISPSGTLVPLYPNLPNDGFAVALAPSEFFNISGNVLARTLQTGVAYSSYGYGQMFTRTGYVNPTVTDAMLVTTARGVVLDTAARYQNIQNNTINGLNAGIYLNGTGTDWQQLKITGNTISDFGLAGIVSAGGMSGGASITINDNTLDGDPYHTSSNRGANGTWLANGNPTGMLIQGAAGLTCQNNVFKRVCRAIDLGAVANQAVFLHNFLEAQVSVTGFSTSNVGIGTCPFAGPAWIYRIVDNNNASATYQTTLNNCLVESTSIPTTGTYVRGHFVANTNPTFAAKVTGWLRLTTGSNHVLNTDWLAVTSA